MPATNTQIINYCLYDKNDKEGRVPFLDDEDKRSVLATKIRLALGLSD